MDSDQESVKTMISDELTDSGRFSSMSDQGSVQTMISDRSADSGRFSSMSDRGSVQTIISDRSADSGRFSSMSDRGSVVSMSSGELTDSRRSSFMSDQGSIKTMREEPQTRIKVEPKPYIKLEQRTPIKNNKLITVSIRGQGSQPKLLQISGTASLDEFISEVNSLFGLGREPGNTYIVYNGKQLSRGTQTVEQAGLRDKSNVELCMRTLGG